ncbi:NADH-quinone oxidoreductase subunit C [Geopsychrobacter electrodiphilus]|uniref:hydrogenase large subunit n=1 Tax=Geopsychrobacter electrodiphilus TaxID=225196 RepID=UPI0003688615|nr:NADH-quinone oxidoreductase subunit C [Geopsychrobacter electrodiphilus]
MSKRQPPQIPSGTTREFAAALRAIGVASTESQALHPGCLSLQISSCDWGKAAELARDEKLRFSTCWGEHCPPNILIFSLFVGGDGQLLLQTQVSEEDPQLPAQTPFFAGASRQERVLQDMLGVQLLAHPDPRRWLRHQAWSEGDFPLRVDFPRAGRPTERTPPDCDYPFAATEGSGVYEIPVGPVHAGIIEPGHFRFQAVGERILRLEEHLGYVHKGIEKIAVGRDLAGLIRLAGRVSGDSTVVHSWAACQAVEQALGVAPSARALALRAIACERERIANHLGDIGAVCNDVGFAFAQVQMTRLRELWQRDNAHVFGHRLMMDYLRPGGVAGDLNTEQVQLQLMSCGTLRIEIVELMPLLLEYPSLQDRLRDTGLLSPAKAARLGALGYVGRASNHQYDLRRDAPYPPYDRLKVEVPAYIEGDVARRVRVRGDEILVSLGLIEELLRKLPAGELATVCSLPGREAQGLGLIEGWRGETLAYVRLGADGTVLRYAPRDPSAINWLALEEMMDDVIVPDFPVCNKSVNGSYSGHDL